LTLYNRAAEGALGDARGARAAPGAAVPAGPDRAGVRRAAGAVPGLGRRRHVHGQHYMVEAGSI